MAFRRAFQRRRCLVTNSTSPTGRISTGPSPRYIERHSSKTVATMLWPLLRSASSSGSKIDPAAAVPQVMMRIDDWQRRFEDGLLLLFCEPRIVGLAAMTFPQGPRWEGRSAAVQKPQQRPLVPDIKRLSAAPTGIDWTRFSAEELEEMPIQELEMTSPYLQPFVALAMALPQLLESIEAELSNEKLEAGDVRHLCRRAELIR